MSCNWLADPKSLVQHIEALNLGRDVKRGVVDFESGVDVACVILSGNKCVYYLLVEAAAAVISAVIFLGDSFGFVNAIGLVVLVFGAGLFNYSKYQKLVEKERAHVAETGKMPALRPAYGGAEGQQTTESPACFSIAMSLLSVICAPPTILRGD